MSNSTILHAMIITIAVIAVSLTKKLNAVCIALAAMHVRHAMKNERANNGTNNLHARTIGYPIDAIKK